MRATGHAFISAALLATLLIAAVADAADNSPPTSPSVALLASFCEQRGVELVIPAEPQRYATNYGEVRCAGLPSHRADDFAAILYSELARYPASFFRRVGITRIVLCHELYCAGQRRTAIPAWNDDTLYFDVLRGRMSERYQRQTIHHELYHVIDLHDDGVVYADAEWMGLNQPGFQYGRGGGQHQHDHGAGKPDTYSPGFITRYARSGAEEDKAELFAYLMIQPAQTAARADDDPVLAAKIELLQSRLRDFLPDRIASN